MVCSHLPSRRLSACFSGFYADSRVAWDNRVVTVWPRRIAPRSVAPCATPMRGSTDACWLPYGPRPRAARQELGAATVARVIEQGAASVETGSRTAACDGPRHGGDAADAGGQPGDRRLGG